MTMLAHVSAISVPLTAASNGLNAAAILFTIIDAPKPSLTGLKGVAVPMNRELVLENINFAYPARHDVRILDGINLRIPAGQMTAIVGSSGSGKSTIVALIQRWYDLSSTDPVGSYLCNGSIKIGDISLGSTDLHWWRSCIGLVQQEPFLFNDTIYKNVEYGLVGTQWEYAPEKVKRQLVMRACREAYADEFVCTLPKVHFHLVTAPEILTNCTRAI
jgi:ABC-type multidrug transport system fused ATPase/permease subunit